MHRSLVGTKCFLAALITVSAASLFGTPKQPVAPDSGELAIIDREGREIGLCPLKHTDVRAIISGPVGRVTVTQEFRNDQSQRIEAVYTFPLPPASAVDSMTMKIGKTEIHGVVKPREEANQIYERARRQGSLAGMLAQERPNIFTQSVANIGPNETVLIEIAYVETMAFDSGRYEFRFPMVVGPRYIPGNPTGGPIPMIRPTMNRTNRPTPMPGGGWAPDTDHVPDASRITPNVAPPGTRAGHDISLAVTLDAGVPLTGLHCTTHETNVERINEHQATVKLVDNATLPNKDFVLTYDVLGKTIGGAVLTHTDSRGKFLTLMLTPPERPKEQEIAPKELVFVLDTSGSMSGFPIEKAKEAMRASLARLNPKDTFNLITFAGDTRILFRGPVPATRENLDRAQRFLDGQAGGGGTEMMRAIRAALDPSDAQDHVRIVCFMTDGYVGNDMEILSEVRKHQNARVFSFGIGSSVNHYLLDRMAAYGRGEVQYVGLQDDGSAAAQKFTERVRNPILTDVRINWGDLGASDIYPATVPDLFGAKPVTVAAKYARAGRHVIRLEGRRGNQAYSREIVDLPTDQPKAGEVATLWARAKVEAIMAGDLSQIQAGTPTPEVRAAITKLGVEYNLVTQFTSFIAVEQRFVTEGGQPKRIEVPVEMPEGVSHDGVFGEGYREVMASAPMMQMRVQPSSLGGMFARRKALPMVAPPPPIATPEARTSSNLEPLRSRDSRAESAKAGKEELQLKLHKTLTAMVQKSSAGQSLSPEEAGLVHNGEVMVEVQFAGSVAKERLAALGFTQVSSAGELKLKGKIALKDLRRLIGLTEVIFVSPA
jgi:Ca-activated chloride channel family protein